MRVADIGTQYGYFTLLFANLVGDTGTVYAFDPDPVSFERMQGNVRRNGYTQVSCSNKGVADRSGTARFYASTLGYGKDSMFPKPNKEMPSYEFPLTTLDEAISGDIDFFKIDVEGAELLVLEGATRILENPAVCGIVEFHPRALIRAGNYESFLPTLRAYNFTIHAINLDGSVEALSDNELRTLAETHDGINIFLRK
jgi:FkbM family methyltransferase